MSEAHKTPCDDIYCEQFLCVQKRDNEGHTELRDWDKRMAEKDAALAKRNARIAALESSLRETDERVRALEAAVSVLRKAAMDYRNFESAERAESLDNAMAATRPFVVSPAPAAKEAAHG